MLSPAPALAISAAGLPAAAPQERVLDTADVLSRAARAELGKTLDTFGADRVDAHLVTVNRLDYGLTLPQLGAELLERWADAGAEPNQLLFLIDSQTNSAAVVAAPALSGQLDSSLLRSTARTTMAQPIRDGGRYRQGSLDAMTRLLTVLEAGEDPGEPVTAEVVTQPTNIPTKEETASSNAFTWVVVLLVLGTLVPMLTWWVFSR
ncbi:photosystem II repair protein Psb32 [Cyanobium sp. T1B-Tous]|uniref:photosystem II repair protein Psb32 n=1 Tax=Cyanobium sp. T1B-Tous TaxID=2823721 RepID=UPI0020CD3C07|nr:TPM domain-containing protein [Cyanobium sp. T1B-Tous]